MEKTCRKCSAPVTDVCSVTMTPPANAPTGAGYWSNKEPGAVVCAPCYAAAIAGRDAAAPQIEAAQVAYRAHQTAQRARFAARPVLAASAPKARRAPRRRIAGTRTGCACGSRDTASGGLVGGCDHCRHDYDS
jgi:hypothetical protein